MPFYSCVLLTKCGPNLSNLQVCTNQTVLSFCFALPAFDFVPNTLSCLHKAHWEKDNTDNSKGTDEWNALPLRGGFENKFTTGAWTKKYKTWCNYHRVKFNSLYYSRGQAQWSQCLISMKTERCFKIRGQVNKIYTVYEVLLEDIKLSLCSSLLISAPYNFFSNPQSFCWRVCCCVCWLRSHLCSRCPSPCSAPLPICLLPHHPT